MDSPLDTADLRSRVQACIDDELAAQAEVLAEIGPDVGDLLEAIRSLLTGGKRLRAAFLYWGYRAAGRPDSDELDPARDRDGVLPGRRAHPRRRHGRQRHPARYAGRPPRALAQHHAGRGWSGDADRFGLAGAILAGNLCLNWTEELYSTCGLPAEELARARHLFDRMRTQLMAGQFLDVVESVRPWDDLGTAERIERASRVIRYKSAKYTIEHPLLIGAAAGGLTGPDLERLSRYGLDLGHAFQLRDDLLGVFGDPATTGKPAGDDLREGKRTVLLAHTLTGADAGGRARVEALLGRPDLLDEHVEDLRGIITGSGAVAAVEAEIERLSRGAREALREAAGVSPEAAAVLEGLIDASTTRSA